jgi:coniferyl-aldehyde dehydrogenase
MSHAAVIPLDGYRESSPIATLRSAFAQMHSLSRSAPPPDVATRRRYLDALERAIRSRQDDVVRAIDADFGARSRHETLVADLFPTLASLHHARKQLSRWAKPRSQPVHWAFQPGTAQVVPQPLGVVGIIAPWNYPLQLALAPLVSVLAAGNRALIKPSELTPRTSALLVELIADALPPDVVSVVEGGPDVAEAFSRLPFDHLLFTGSTRIGYVVMKAAAENLTPVTLELGGKSPAIVHDSFAMDKAAERILMGKLLNAGQTCIAPDYVLLPRGRTGEFVAACRAVMAKTRPTLRDNPDYTAIVNDRQYARLQGLLAEAQAAGATLEVLNPASEELPASGRKIAPTLVMGAPDQTAVMQDEIFGPILPLVEYGALDEAIAYVNARPRPLALYYFDRDSARIGEVVGRTTSGGVTVNDTLMHIAQEELPFGGVGPAGMGAYHGKAGFDNFSHLKGVFQQSRLNAGGLLNPPYGKTIERLLGVLMGS